MSEYNLIILCGKSGAGKDYILNELLNTYPKDVSPIILDTTRPRRGLELNGKDYNFLTEEEYFKKEHIGEQIFNNWYYGIPIDSLKKDKINIGILSPQAIENLYSKDNFNIVLFYITASDKERILRQINREPYPDILEICRRFLADEEDFKNLYKYPFRKLRNSFNYDVSQCIGIIKKSIEKMKKLYLV